MTPAKIERYLRLAKAHHMAMWCEPAKPWMLTPSGKHLKKSYLRSEEYRRGNHKLNARAASILRAKQMLGEQAW